MTNHGGVGGKRTMKTLQYVSNVSHEKAIKSNLLKSVNHRQHSSADLLNGRPLKGASGVLQITESNTVIFAIFFRQKVHKQK